MGTFTELPPEVTREILLGNDERIVFAANASYRSASIGSAGISPGHYLVMTNKRIMYVERHGKQHDISHSIYLERIRA